MGIKTLLANWYTGEKWNFCLQGQISSKIHLYISLICTLLCFHCTFCTLATSFSNRSLNLQSLSGHTYACLFFLITKRPGIHWPILTLYRSAETSEKFWTPHQIRQHFHRAGQRGSVFARWLPAGSQCISPYLPSTSRNTLYSQQAKVNAFSACERRKLRSLSYGTHINKWTHL